MTVAYTADLLEKVRTGVELWGPLGTSGDSESGENHWEKAVFLEWKGMERKGKENGGLGMENDGLRQVEWFIPPKNGDEFAGWFIVVLSRDLQKCAVFHTC